MPAGFIMEGVVPVGYRGDGSCAAVGSTQFDVSLIPTTTATPPVTAAQGVHERCADFTSEVPGFYF